VEYVIPLQSNFSKLHQLRKDGLHDNRCKRKGGPGYNTAIIQYIA